MIKKVNKNLENYLQSSGKILNISKNEIKATLKTRKNVVLTFILMVAAFAFAQIVSYGTLRYTGASIYEFTELGKFL